MESRTRQIVDGRQRIDPRLTMPDLLAAEKEIR
jgi:hypothetical protein